MKSIKSAYCGRHFRSWEKGSEFVIWGDDFKSRRSAEKLRQSILDSNPKNPNHVLGFLMSKNPRKARRWQLIVWGSNKAISI